MNRIVIIGNGFDISHGLPVKADLLMKDVSQGYWSHYNGDKWSGYESDLANPDIEAIIDYLSNYCPDYLSDYESDRNAIIIEVSITPSAKELIEELIGNAVSELENVSKINKYESVFETTDMFVSFNYTPTLEDLYSIDSDSILYIHGEYGENELLFGHGGKVNYGEIFNEVKHGQGHFVDAKEFLLEKQEDYYYRESYSNLVEQIEGNNKELQLSKLEEFIQDLSISELITIGFSFGEVDAPYFELLAKAFPKMKIIATGYNEEAVADITSNIKTYYNLENVEYKIF